MIQLRLATNEDLPAIVDLDRRCSPVFRDAQSYSRLLPGVSGLLMVAVQNAHVCGLAAWSLVDVTAELLNLAVSQEARGRGIGRRLMETSRDTLGQRQVDRLILDVRESNLAARGLYLSLDFRVDGRRRAYYPGQSDGRREDALLMSCELEVAGARSRSG